MLPWSTAAGGFTWVAPAVETSGLPGEVLWPDAAAEEIGSARATLARATSCRAVMVVILGLVISSFLRALAVARGRPLVVARVLTSPAGALILITRSMAFRCGPVGADLRAQVVGGARALGGHATSRPCVGGAVGLGHGSLVDPRSRPRASAREAGRSDADTR